MPKLDPDNADPKEILTLIVAMVAAHAIISRGHSPEQSDKANAIVKGSFDFAEKFIAEAERR